MSERPRFIRVRGRIVPLREKKTGPHKGLLALGYGLQVGSGAIGFVKPKMFMTRSGVAAIVASQAAVWLGRAATTASAIDMEGATTREKVATIAKHQAIAFGLGWGVVAAGVGKNRKQFSVAIREALRKLGRM